MLFVYRRYKIVLVIILSNLLVLPCFGRHVPLPAIEVTKPKSDLKAPSRELLSKLIGTNLHLLVYTTEYRKTELTP